MLNWYAGQAVTGARILAPARKILTVVRGTGTPPIAAMTDPAQAFDWFETELANLRAAARHAVGLGRHDITAQIAVFLATGIRLSELTGICYSPDDPARNDLDLQAREIRVRAKARRGSSASATMPPAA
jgi:hypothetical protein